MRRLITTLAMLAVAAAAFASPRASAATGRQHCFEETQKCISGAILDYWERNGGLAVFGYPISVLREETVEGSWSGPTQWFQRDRLEDHGAEGVLAGRLGARYLQLNGTPWESFGRVDSAPAGCQYFAETGHSLCEPFLSYWRSNGGLARFGYPITEPQQQTISGWTGTVQYFERRRMEHHTENTGTPFEVLLGLLGTDVLARDVPAYCNIRGTLPQLRAAVAAAPFREALGCSSAAYSFIDAAAQNFQKGKMIWVNLAAYGDEIDRGRKIIAINEGIAPFPVYGRYDDTWTEGEPVSGGQTPPPGLYEPVRGFGKIWRGSRGLGQFIGWATEPERAEKAQVQFFTGGGLAIWLQGENTVYVFGPTGDQVYVHRN